jgi:C1A family cysteine protease
MKQYAMGLKNVHDPKYDTFDKLEVDEKSLPVVMPSKVDYSPQYPPPSDQGQLGTCVAFASAKVFDFYHLRRLNNKQFISARAVYAQAKASFEQGDRTDDGLNVSDGLGAISEYYVYELDYPSFPDGSEKDFPSYLEIAPANIHHTDFLVQNILTVTASVSDMRKAIYQKGPLVIGLSWPNSWFNIGSDGLLPEPDTSAGGHCVNIVGYDDKIANLDGTYGAFNIINNWTTQWGAGGYAWLPYSLQGSDYFPTDVFNVVVPPAAKTS